MAHLSGRGWYLECHITYTPPAEVEYWKLFEGLGAIDLDIEEFAGLIDR